MDVSEASDCGPRSSTPVLKPTNVLDLSWPFSPVLKEVHEDVTPALVGNITDFATTTIVEPQKFNETDLRNAGLFYSSPVFPLEVPCHDKPSRASLSNRSWVTQESTRTYLSCPKVSEIKDNASCDHALVPRNIKDEDEDTAILAQEISDDGESGQIHTEKKNFLADEDEDTTILSQEISDDGESGQIYTEKKNFLAGQSVQGHLQDPKQAPSKTDRLKLKINKKSHQIKNLKAKVLKLTEQLQQAESQINSLEGKIDKSHVKQLVVNCFMAAPNNQLEALRNVATVLDFSHEERVMVGLERVTLCRGSAATAVAESQIYVVETQNEKQQGVQIKEPTVQTRKQCELQKTNDRTENECFIASNVVNKKKIALLAKSRLQAFPDVTPDFL